MADIRMEIIEELLRDVPGATIKFKIENLLESRERLQDKLAKTEEEARRLAFLLLKNNIKFSSELPEVKRIAKAGKIPARMRKDFFSN